MTDLTARTQPEKPDCSRAPSLTDRITEILLSPVEGSGGTPLYLGINGHRLGDRGFAYIHYAALIAAATEEHYRPLVDAVEQLNELPDFAVLRDAVGNIWEKEHHADQGPWWRTSGPVEGEDAAAVRLPAVVLWSPGADE